MATLERRSRESFARLAMLTCCFLAPSVRSTAQSQPKEWTFSLSARESNEIDRVTNGVSEADLIQDNFMASFGVSNRAERSRYGFVGRVGYDFYREGESQDQLLYGAAFAWDHDPSPRFRSLLSFGIDRGITADTLSSLGVLAPGVDSTSGMASWAIQHQKSPRTTIASSFSYNYVLFETDQPITGSQLVLGQSPFRDDFPPILSGPSDTGELELPDAEQSLLGIVATEGFSSPQTTSHWGSATFGVTQRLTEYTSMGFDFGGSYRTIERTGVGNQDGAEAGFRFWSQRRIGESKDVGGAYSLMRSLVNTPSTTVHSLVGGFGYYPRGKSMTLRVSGGVSYYQAESVTSQITPVADVSFGTGLTRSTTFSAAYRRQFAQSLGFGSTLLIDYASLALTQSFGRKVDLSLQAGASLASDPLIENSGYDAFNAGAALTWKIVESLSAGTSFFVLDTRSTTASITSDTTRNLWTIFVAYTTRWN
jgi:hypothetical protein